jgi:hypothetical protein
VFKPATKDSLDHVHPTLYDSNSGPFDYIADSNQNKPVVLAGAAFFSPGYCITPSRLVHSPQLYRPRHCCSLSPESPRSLLCAGLKVWRSSSSSSASSIGARRRWSLACQRDSIGSASLAGTWSSLPSASARILLRQLPSSGGSPISPPAASGDAPRPSSLCHIILGKSPRIDPLVTGSKSARANLFTFSPNADM